MLLFAICEAWQPLFTIHLLCKKKKKKSSMNMLWNLSFCVLQEKESHTGLERCEGD